MNINISSEKLNQIEDLQQIEAFLDTLKNNPDHILNAAIKREYLDLVYIAFEEAKHNSFWGDLIPELLKLRILGKENKEQYLDLVHIAFENVKNNSHWAKYIIPELLKLGILEKEEVKERYIKLLDFLFEGLRSNSDWASYVIPEVLRLGVLDKEEVKERYLKLVNIAFERAKRSSQWARYVIPELGKLGILGKENKEQYLDLVNIAFENVKNNSDWAKYIIPELLKLGIIEKEEVKEQYLKLLHIAFEKAKNNSDWAGYAIPGLLKLGIIEKEEMKEQYLKLLDIAFENAKNNSDWARYAIPGLLKLGIIEKEEMKEQYFELLDIAFENAKDSSDSARYIIPELLKLEILGKEDREQYLELLDIAFERAKDNSDSARYIIPELLKLGILGKEDKEQYLELLDIAFEKAKNNRDWARYIIPELLKLEILGKEEVKEQYLELLHITVEKVGWQGDEKIYAILHLLKLGILGKEDKEQYLELVHIVFEKAKNNSDWARYVIPELLKLGILGKEDKEQYLELLDIAFEKAKNNRDWARYVIPELLKLGILGKGVIEQIRLGKFFNYNISDVAFLTKYKNNVSSQHLINFSKLDTILNKEEKHFLCKQNYEDFATLQDGLQRKDYKPLRNIKQRFYPREEQAKLQNLIAYFGDEVWTYFFDKVHTEKELKNRFREPHNALLHTDKIIQLAQELEKKGVSKADFIKNYLGVAGDRNNGYQQLNSFLERYFFCQYDNEEDNYDDYYDDYADEENNDIQKGSNKIEEIQTAMDIPEFQDNPEFVACVQRILDQDKTGELYKNLDTLEQILSVLNMLNQKESLIKLHKLAVSKDSKDEIRYNYFKNAIYHPRTKPLIMDMYERPQRFLGLDDTTFEDINPLHQAKKPSNMVENFPHLDFSAEDLVNCLPLGVYDKLSYFKPYEKQYLVNGSSVYTLQEVKNQLSDFFFASDQKRMSTIITKYNALFPDTPLSFKTWKENPQNFVENLLGESDFTLWIELFTQLGYQEFNKYKNLRLMTAKISPKADPNNRFNGFNCDALAEGHGKKVVAMFNPYCTDFCVYDGEPDPETDNLKVTSRVTLNRAIPHNFSSLLEKAKTSTTYDIAKLFGKDFEDYKDPKEYVITMDNIEADANFGNKHAMAIRKIYEDFFSDYIRQHPLSPNGVPLNTSKFYSGKSYNKIDILEKSEENQTLPVFVNAYTDNADSQSLVGELNAGPQAEKVKKTGIHPLSIEDVIQISYLEGKIYPETMKHHLGNLQHEITASVLNNQLKGRANLSFAWYDEMGKVRGYLLAYQGKMEDGRAGIYLSDFAIDQEARGRSGLEMIRHWIQQVKEYYPGMPVFTRAREGTSYRVLMALVEKNGYQITEQQKVRDAGENFYWITMEPKKS